MTNTPAKAAIMLAHPIRADRAGYRCCLFHGDDSTEVSPRLSYDAARAFAADRGAQIAFDEADRLAVDQPFKQ